jgi:uncharacterized protein (TIGR04255 family)
MTQEGDIETICYKRNFLTEVIARVDFVSPVEGIVNELPKSVAKAALTSFPIDEPKPIIMQELAFSKEGVDARTKKQATEWNFYGRAREKRLVIGPQAVFVTTGKYIEYGPFRDEFCSVLDVFFSEYAESQPSRLGLRYVNELKLPGVDPLDWTDHLDESLLPLLKYKVEGARPCRVFHDLEFAFDDFNVHFRFGLHNPDYPAPICQKVFVMDFDAYCRGLLEPSDISSNLDSYHRQIQGLFERSISETMRKVLNEDK